MWNDLYLRNHTYTWPRGERWYGVNARGDNDDDGKTGGGRGRGSKLAQLYIYDVKPERKKQRAEEKEIENWHEEEGKEKL